MPELDFVTMMPFDTVSVPVIVVPVVVHFWISLVAMQTRMSLVPAL